MHEFGYPETSIWVGLEAGGKALKTSISARLAGLCVVGAAAIAATTAFAHNAIEVGHHASGQVFPHWHQDEPALLPVSTFPGIKGWAGVPVGFEALFKDEPGHDLFVLDPKCSIQFILLAADPGMFVMNDTGTGHMKIGESFNLGNPYFHAHPVFHLENGVYGQTYTLQFKFIDTTGLYTESGTVDVDFIPHCPGDVIVDNVIDVDDLLGVINGWGDCGAFCEDGCPADLNHTCAVNVDDLLIVVNNWGSCND